MKTRDQLAEEYSRKVNDPYYDELYPCSDGTIGEVTKKEFIVGFEEAQRWFSVNDEIIETRKDSNSLSKVVLCKSEFFTESFSAYYDSMRGAWKLYPTHTVVLGVTHFRPIERT